MSELNVRQWAVKGAEQRLVEIAEEAKAIFAAFPELRGRGRGFGAGVGGATAVKAPKVRKRRKISAAGRRRISDAQKARWAKQKAAQGTSTSEAVTPQPKRAKVARKKR